MHVLPRGYDYLHMVCTVGQGLTRHLRVALALQTYSGRGDGGKGKHRQMQEAPIRWGQDVEYLPHRPQGYAGSPGVQAREATQWTGA